MSECEPPKPPQAATYQNKKPSRIPTRPLSVQARNKAESEVKGSPVKTRTRHTSGKEKKAGISYSSSKENITPAPAKKLNPKRYKNLNLLAPQASTCILQRLGVAIYLAMCKLWKSLDF